MLSDAQASGRRALRDEFERVAVRGTDDREVPVVQGRDLRLAEPFSGRHNGRVDQTQTEVFVGFDQLDTPRPVGEGEVDEPQMPARDEPKERCLRASLLHLSLYCIKFNIINKKKP